MEANPDSTSTRSVGMKYGLMAGLAGIVLFLIPVVLGQNPFKGAWNWIGAAVSIGLMILAHKSYKDNGDGFMSYGQGVGIGFWLTLVSTVLSIIFMYVYLNFIDAGPMDLFIQEQQETMEKSGQSEQAIEMAMEWTRKLFWVIALIGGIFWGMIIALILTIFTQKKAPEQAF